MRHTIILFLLLAFANAYPQQPEKSPTPALTQQQVHSLALLGELWGFLKYYHPAVAKGTQDWDSVLIQKIPLYLDAQNSYDINRLTAGWLNETGVPPNCRKCDNHIADSLWFNLDLSWINETNFSKETVDRLFFIRDNRNQGANRYVSLIKYSSLHAEEKPYDSPEFQYPSAGYRLLLLFRYWNIVNYFSPYKYICGRDWKEVLRKKIPAFYAAADTLAYQLEYVKLVTGLHDGHAFFSTSPVLQRYFGKNHFAPFLCKYIDGQLVVSGHRNDSLSKLIRMQTGDLLLEINGEKLSDKMKRYKEYRSASNDAVWPFLFATFFLFTGPDNNFVVKKIRDGREITDSFEVPPLIAPRPDTSRPWRLLKDNIGYVNLGRIKKPQVNTIMQALASTRGIIFDLRSYPDNIWETVAGYLSPKTFVFGRTTSPDIDYPGVFRFYKYHMYGRRNRHSYTGRVVILVDETTVSAAEYTAIGLQAATKTMTIGSTTAGQNGNISDKIYLPGGFYTYISSLGIYYIDGTIEQRNGVKIDKTVIPTIRGLREGKDEVLEAGIDYIKSN